MPWSACWMEDLVYGQTDQQMHKLDSKRLWVTTHWRFDWTEVQMDGSHAKIKQINDGIVHTAKAVSPTKGVYMCELRRFACGFVCFAECALIFRCKWGGEHFTLLVFYGQRQLGHHSSVFDVTRYRITKFSSCHPLNIYLHFFGCIRECLGSVLDLPAATLVNIYILIYVYVYVEMFVLD